MGVDLLPAFDPNDRELCPDGGCIGLIGADGFCKECGTAGRSAKLDPRRRGLKSTDEVAAERDDDGDDEAADSPLEAALDAVESRSEEAIAAGSLPPAAADFDDRQLCPDGACIGVLGSDGACKVCGTEEE